MTGLIVFKVYNVCSDIHIHFRMITRAKIIEISVTSQLYVSSETS